LQFAEVEAGALIRAHLGAVTALADALIERGTLNGDEVDAIITRAVDIEKLAAEKQRRREMQIRAERAEKFMQLING
jgi:hypothetical protein